MSVKWVEWNGKEILYADFRGLKRAQLIPNLEQTAHMLENSQGQVLLLLNFKDVSVHFAYLKRCNELGQKVIHSKTEKLAVLGIDGIKATMFVTFNRIVGQKSASFQSEQKAKDWLTE